MDRVDIAIIGAGPAGISAALNAQIRHKSFLLFGNSELSHKVWVSKELDNYPGIPRISGEQLCERFREHLESMQISVTEERITGVYNMGGYFMILADQKEYEATSVILATGSEMAKPVPGERELLGRGVSYCATCDGNLYKGKNIAVICDNESMEEEVEYLAELAGTVHYFPTFKSSLEGSNIIRHKSSVQEIEGEDLVSGIVLHDGEKIQLDGVFFIKNAVAADILLRGLDMNEGHINVDRNMATNIKGCYAAGDCTGRPYQIAKAVGEGNVALHSVLSYLASK